MSSLIEKVLSSRRWLLTGPAAGDALREGAYQICGKPDKVPVFVHHKAISAFVDKGELRIEALFGDVAKSAGAGAELVEAFRLAGRRGDLVLLLECGQHAEGDLDLLASVHHDLDKATILATVPVTALPALPQEWSVADVRRRPDWSPLLGARVVAVSLLLIAALIVAVVVWPDGAARDAQTAAEHEAVVIAVAPFEDGSGGDALALTDRVTEELRLFAAARRDVTVIDVESTRRSPRQAWDMRLGGSYVVRDSQAAGSLSVLRFDVEARPDAAEPEADPWDRAIEEAYAVERSADLRKRRWR